MTSLVLAWVVIGVIAVLVGYLAVALVVMAVRGCLQRCPRPGEKTEAVHEQVVPRWTSLDDHQMARYLRDSPP